MKLNEDPDQYTIDFSAKMKKQFSDVEIASILLTLLGTSDLTSRFVWTKVQDFIDLPLEIKYAIVQHASIMDMMISIIRNEFKKKEGPKVNFMPVTEEGWKTQEDFEERFILIVKTFYKNLKEQGKL